MDIGDKVADVKTEEVGRAFCVLSQQAKQPIVVAVVAAGTTHALDHTTTGDGVVRAGLQAAGGDGAYTERCAVVAVQPVPIQ